MIEPTRKLLEQALKLPAAERAALVRDLVDSLLGEDEALEEAIDVDPAFAAELERRAAELPLAGSSWPTGEQVVAEALKRVADHRRTRGG